MSVAIFVIKITDLMVQSLKFYLALFRGILLILDFVVQSVSHVQLFRTPWTAAHQASLSFTVSQSVLRLMSIELMMPSNHLILCCSPPPALNLSQHQDLLQ